MSLVPGLGLDHLFCDEIIAAGLLLPSAAVLSPILGAWKFGWVGGNAE